MKGAYLMFSLENIGSKIVAAVSALAVSAVFMAAAVVPASPNLAAAPLIA